MLQCYYVFFCVIVMVGYVSKKQIARSVLFAIFMISISPIAILCLACVGLVDSFRVNSRGRKVLFRGDAPLPTDSTRKKAVYILGALLLSPLVMIISIFMSIWHGVIESFFLNETTLFRFRCLSLSDKISVLHGHFSKLALQSGGICILLRSVDEYIKNNPDTICLVSKAVSIFDAISHNFKKVEESNGTRDLLNALEAIKCWGNVLYETLQNSSLVDKVLMHTKISRSKLNDDLRFAINELRPLYFGYGEGKIVISNGFIDDIIEIVKNSPKEVCNFFAKKREDAVAAPSVSVFSPEEVCNFFAKKREDAVAAPSVSVFSPEVSSVHPDLFGYVGITQI